MSDDPINGETPPAPSEASEQPPASRRGGARPGAGRKPRGYLPPSALRPIDIDAELAAPIPVEIDGVAQKHVRDMVQVLARTMIHGRSEPARIMAANRLLDRGYGRPAVEIGGDAWLPFQAAPAASGPSLVAEVRGEARKYANLAIAILKRIAELGESEAARVAAAESLITRGLGTVGTARMPEEIARRQATPVLGKKEEATAAAKMAATGAYATPSPPRSSLQ